MNKYGFIEAEIPESLGFPPLIMKTKSRKMLVDLLTPETMELVEKAAPLLVAGIEAGSITDGPGIRLSVFGQGCLHHCKGCHNPQTHSLEGGEPMLVKDILERVLSNPLCAGLTLTGGDPLIQVESFSVLAKAAKEMGYSVVTYTGYLLEKLEECVEKLMDVRKSHTLTPAGDTTTDYRRSDQSAREAAKAIDRLLRSTDILIDGPFVISKRNLELSFRGSDNQRIWVKKTA